MKPTTRIAALAASLIAALAVVASPAGATPGQYTKHGDVLVTAVAVGGCATVTWPRGYTEDLCDDVDQVTHRDIVPGDRFGAKITSWGNAGVSCRVLDVETGDLVHSASGLGTADCIRKAV